MTEPRGRGRNREKAPTVQAAVAPAGLELRAAKLTDVGRARPHNEDYVEFVIPPDPAREAQKGAIFAVADGMGGHQAGEVASKGAVEAAIAHYQADTGQDAGNSLVRAFRAANQQLYAQSQRNPSQGGMGTTLVVAVILGRKVYVANVGDSRAYLINSRVIRQITEDHSWVEEQVRAGLLDEEQARSHPQRNLVTRALGSKPAVEVDLFEGEITAGDSLLLCSDGLTGRVSDQEIGNIVRELPPPEAAGRLVALANERGGHDNITVLIVNADEAMPAGKEPVAAARGSRPARRTRVLSMLAAAAGLLLLGAAAAGILAASGVLPLSFLTRASETPAMTVIASPYAPATGTTQAGPSTSVPVLTATLRPSETARLPASPSPLQDAVTLISPADGISLTGVVTFTWAFGPGTLPQDLTFQLVIGRGDPPDPGARRIGLPDRRAERRVALDEYLEKDGEYYWTVFVVEANGDGRVVSEASPRPFVYDDETPPGPSLSRAPGSG